MGFFNVYNIFFILIWKILLLDKMAFYHKNELNFMSVKWQYNSVYESIISVFLLVRIWFLPQGTVDNNVGQAIHMIQRS